MHSIHGEIAQTILGPCGIPSFLFFSFINICPHKKYSHVYYVKSNKIFQRLHYFSWYAKFFLSISHKPPGKGIVLLKTIRLLEHVLSNEHEHLQASNCCLVFRSHKLSISAPITVPCTQCASEEIDAIMQSLAKLKGEGIFCSLYL